MSVKKILMIVGDYVEDYEVMVPFQALLMVGHTVHAVCPGKQAGERVRTAVHEFEGDQTYSEKPGHNFTLNASFAEVRAEDYAALVIPGGYAPDRMRLRHAMVDLARDAMTAGKLVAAICHGPQLLITAGVIKDRHTTCYHSVAEELKEAGALYEDSEVVVDGNLVTSRQPSDLPAFMRETLRMASKIVH